MIVAAWLLAVVPMHWHSPCAQDRAVESSSIRSKSRPDGLSQSATSGAEAARVAHDRAITWILAHQNPDGSWGTATPEAISELGCSNSSFYAWRLAGGAISILALLGAEERPPLRVALDRAVDHVLEAERPRRGNDWDIVNNWTALYVTILLDELARDPRYQGDPWSTRIAARGAEYLKHLAGQQDPLGGWGYYEGDVISRRPTWSTSFSTACVIPSLVSARERGWPVEAKMLERAIDYVRRCELPNGAYEYDLNPIPRLSGGEHINQVKGSLGRIQVCHWARHVAGDPEVALDKLREGLRLFFEHHRFLDVARMRPVPHEAHYANSGYFYFFGHYYAAKVVELLPEEERQSWHERLRVEILKAQGRDGQFIDFPGSFYSYTYATGFAALTLQEGLRGGATRR